MLMPWKREHTDPILVALRAEIPPSHVLFLALGEARAREFLQRTLQRFAHRAAAHGGVVARMDLTSMLVLFERADAALLGARALRQDLQDWVRPIAHEVDLHVDIGLSLGAVQCRPPVYEGQTILRAIALSAASQGGQILLDDAAASGLSDLQRSALQRVFSEDLETGLKLAWLDPAVLAAPSQGPEPLWLCLQRPHGGLERIFTPGPSIRIGRSAESDVIVDREGVSRQHAVILWRDGDYVFSDISRNGTWLQYGTSGVITRVAHDASPLHAAGALYFGNAPGAGRAPDLLFLVEKPCELTGRPQEPMVSGSDPYAPTAMQSGGIVLP